MIMFSSSSLLLLFCGFVHVESQRYPSDPVAAYESCLEKEERSDRQLCIVVVMAEAIKFPTSYGIIMKEIATPWFADSLRGRIMPTGAYPTRLTSIQYFYGVATASSILNGFENPGYVIHKVYYHYPMVDADLVSVRADFEGGNYPDFTCTSNMTLSGNYRFNEEGTQIISYDVIFARFQETISELQKCSQTVNDYATFICAIHDQFCKGTEYQQYWSLDRRDLPFCAVEMQNIAQGTWDKPISNTKTCRYLHSVLATVDPAIHCAHIGPDHPFCQDFPFSLYYTRQY